MKENSQADKRWIPPAVPRSREIFNAYVDGFNLYKGVLERRPHLKWLDLTAYLAAQMPDCELGRVFYFTAPVKELFSGDDAPRRQHRYLRVLADQGVEVVYGKFRRDSRWIRVARPIRKELIQPELRPMFGLTQRVIDDSFWRAHPDMPKAQVVVAQEKGSDVNLGAYLLRDTYTAENTASLVVTGDSDLCTPIKFAVEAGHFVKVLVPNRKQSVDSLRAVASQVSSIRPADLADHQLPGTVITRKGRHIVRPREWH